MRLSWGQLADRGGRSLAWAAFFLAAALAFALIVFLRPQNFLLAGWDYQHHQFFLKTFLAESLRAGELPLWIPYLGAGRPFAADPQSGVFYPAHLLYTVLSVPRTVTALVILHLAAAGFFCFLLARELKLSLFASLLSGVMLMFNGFLMTRAYRGQSERLEAVALLPLVFLLIERAERRGQLRWYVWAGLAGALQLLAGAPQIAWLTWISGGVYVLVRRAGLWPQGRGRALARSLVGLALAVAFMAGLAAVQILPTVELVGLSNRGEGSIEFSSASAFLPHKVIHFLFPNCFLAPPREYFNSDAESSGYVGLLGLVLAMVGLFRCRSRVRWALLAVILLNGCIMLGQATPLFGVLYHTLPGLSGFRIPSRAVLMLTVCLCLLAGMGAEAIWRPPPAPRTRRFAVFTAGALFLTMILLAHDLGRLAEGGIFGTTALWPALLLAALALAAVLLAWRPARKWVQGVWLLVIAADLTFVGATMEQYRDFERRVFRPPSSEGEIIEQLRGDRGLYRFALPGSMARENCGVLAGHAGVNAFIALSLERYYNFVHYMTWQRRPKFETHTPASGVFSPDHPFPFKLLNVRYGVGRDPRTGEDCLIERDDYLPRAFFVSRWEVLDDDQAVLQAVRDRDFNPRAVVLFDQDPGVEFSSVQDGLGKVELVDYGPRRITVRADVAADGFLILSEMHYPGWRAYVDGEEVPVLRADYLLRAIPLRAGLYDRIEVRYEPHSFAAGLAITALSTVVFVATLVVTARRSGGAGACEPQEESPTHDAGVIGRAWFGTHMVVVLGAFLCLPILLQPHYAACWARMAYHFADRGEAEQAAAAMRRALGKSPGSYAVNLWIGRALWRAGRNQEAAERLQLAARKEPQAAEVHNSLGVLLLVTGELDRSIEHLRRSHELNPENSDFAYNLGIALMRGGRHQEAAGRLKEAFRIAPGDAHLHLEAAELWADHGRFARSISVLREGLSRRPKNPELLNALARQLATCPEAKLRDGPEAVSLARRACQETGYRNPRMLMTLAAARAENGDVAPAMEVAQRARALAVQAGDTALIRRLEALSGELRQRRGAEFGPERKP